MGNSTSSCFQISFPKHKTAKLIDSHGNIRKIKLPVKAGELMLENPGFVLSPVDDLHRTGRLIALRAEDELLPAKIYLFVPLNRVNHKISESEMEILESLISGKIRSRKRHRGAKVLPAVPVESEVQNLEEDAGLSGCRLGKCGVWTPVLDPISEDQELCF